jgi:hypothetical protein
LRIGGGGSTGLNGRAGSGGIVGRQATISTPIGPKNRPKKKPSPGDRPFWIAT